MSNFSSFSPLLEQVGTHFIPFYDAQEAVDQITNIYKDNTDFLKKAFQNKIPNSQVEAVYPYLAFIVTHENLPKTRPPFDIILKPGVYGTTLTHPELFSNYWLEQIQALITHYNTPVLVGKSLCPIPLPYVTEEAVSKINIKDIQLLNKLFILPDLQTTNDKIANCEVLPNQTQEVRPLSLFTAERIDYSLARLHHYTETSPCYFQNFVLLTNYQLYIQHFCNYGYKQINSDSEYKYLVASGDQIFQKGDKRPDPSSNLPQMPTYHLCRPDGNGITLINIGVGPANAKTITDHLAVLRPHCWLMLGHCAGLRSTQQLGDYVLAHGYAREDHVLDEDLPPWVPVPAIAEVQQALQEVTARITGMRDTDLKSNVLRTGTVMTTDNRNWELRFSDMLYRINVSRTIAIDMESATVAANGFRFRVPYGTLLCVSDKPLHGELKLRGMANEFYRRRVNQHLQVGIETMRLLREQGINHLHSRKLRGINEPPFR